MKHLFLRFVAAAMLGTATTAYGQTIVYEQHFDTEAAFNTMTTVNADNFSYNDTRGVWKWNSYGTKAAYIYLSTYSDDWEANDDYLLTPEIALEAGKAYSLSSLIDGYYSSDVAKCQIAVGTGDDPTTFTVLYTNENIKTSTGFTVEQQFEVPQSGNYRISYRAYGVALRVDDIVLTDIGFAGAPAAVSDLVATAAADLSLSADISFVTPTQTSTGGTLTALSKVELYRGEDLINTYEAPALGATLTWTDAAAQAGYNTYRVIAYADDKVGTEASVTVYVGPDTPKAVTALTVAAAADGFTLSWTAPTKGAVLNSDLDASALTYTITRVVGDAETVVATGVAETSYTDAFAPAELTKISYKVVANYHGTTSEATASSSLIAGKASLPFDDSFAGKTLNEFWTIETSSSSYKWTASNYPMHGNAEPVDEDGGLLYYNAYNAQRGNYSRLISPLLNIADTTLPMLSFYIYHDTSNSSKADRVIVEVKTDGGEFTEVGSYNRYSSTEGWEQVFVNLNSYKTASTFQISLKAYSEYGTDIVIDAVSIYDDIAPSAPKPVDNLNAVITSTTTYSVSWASPTTTVKEKPIDAEGLTYDVWRIVDGEETLLKSAYAREELNDTYEPQGLQKLQYKVVAHYDGLESAPALSNELEIGFVEIPFADSFAGATISDQWTLTTTNTSYPWTAVSSGSSPSASPYDADGGMLMYKSYSAQAGNEVTMTTPPLNIASSANPVVEFWMYHDSNSSTKEDKVNVLISCDGGEFQLLDGADILRYSAVTGWTKHSFSLVGYKDAVSVKIQFKGISKYGYNIFIDAINIYNKAEYDMAAVALDAPEIVYTGNIGNFTVKVRNNGAATVDGTAYQVDLYNGDTLVTTVDGVDVGVDAIAEIPVSLTYSALDAATYNYYAEIVYRADEVGENNSTEPKTVVVATYPAPAVDDLGGSIQNRNNVVTSWTAPVNTDEVEPFSLTENFDSFTELTYDSQIGEFTNIDGDQLDTRVWFDSYITKGPKGFFVFSTNFVNSSSTVYAAHSGKNLLAALGSSSGDSDDWFISPELPGTGIATLSFYTKLGSSYDKGVFRIEYSTTDAQPQSFIPLTDNVTVSGYQMTSWTKMSYEIPADARYVAIHHVSGTTDWGLLIDDISIETEPFTLLGYNVYRDGVKINNELVTEPTYTDLDLGNNTYNYNVTAVYEGGESALSNDYTITLSDSSVGELNADDVRVVVRNRLVASFSAGALTESRVYNPGGAIVAQGSGWIALPTAGVYFVVNCSGKATKIIVR